MNYVFRNISNRFENKKMYFFFLKEIQFFLYGIVKENVFQNDDCIQRGVKRTLHHYGISKYIFFNIIIHIFRYFQ